MTDNLPARRADIVANKNLVQLTMEEMYRFAQGYARAGYIQGKTYNEVATPDDLFVRISAGQAIGLDPYTSVSEMYFVKGKLTMSTNLQLALAKASGKYEWRVEWGNSLMDLGIDKDELNAAGVTTAVAASWPNPKWCRFIVMDRQTKEELGVSIWSLLDSHRAGLLIPSNNGAISNHLKYPRAMMFNRAGSSAVAYFMPDATMIRMYDHGEIEGDVWDHTTKVTAEVEREDAEEEIQDADIVDEPEAPTSPEAVHVPTPREGDDPEAPIFKHAGEARVNPEDETSEQHYERTATGNAGAVAGEVLPGESSHEAMERMVAEEALDPAALGFAAEEFVAADPKGTARGFDPATEPPPPVVRPPGEPVEQPPAWATGDAEAQPTVETEAGEEKINAGRKGLLWVLVKRAQLTDGRRHEIWTEVTGQPHMERTPDRFFQALVDRLNAEAEIVETTTDDDGSGEESESGG